MQYISERKHWTAGNPALNDQASELLQCNLVCLKKYAEAVGALSTKRYYYYI